MSLNIAKDSKKRVVIVGGGFGGLKLANKLKKNRGFQVVLIDKNNYHQFPPLIYQVASAGMEPTSISFPFRKIFSIGKIFISGWRKYVPFFPEKNLIQTSMGKAAEYDYLVLAAGTTTNFFGNKHIEEEAMPMKNVSEAMGLRNAFGQSGTCGNLLQQMGATGITERCGRWWRSYRGGSCRSAFEMKKFVLPNDYPDMPSSLMHIYLMTVHDYSPECRRTHRAMRNSSCAKWESIFF